MLDKLLSGALQGMIGERQGQDPLMQILSALLSDKDAGGLAGLVQQFQRAGLGEQAQSWIGRGQTMPISVEQLMQVFGRSNMQQMAASAGLDEQDFGGKLAQLLPQAVDQLTPEGEIPSAGIDDVLGMLSQLTPR
jgi:uncharacterized protein YidB (DUF937 family)